MVVFNKLFKRRYLVLEEIKKDDLQEEVEVIEIEEIVEEVIEEIFEKLELEFVNECVDEFENKYL